MRPCARKVIMKKALMIFCIVLVAVLACSVFVACNPQVNPGEDNNGHNQYEQAKYTVTFNVNSNDFKLTNNVVKKRFGRHFGRCSEECRRL